jgi:thiamine monophosphate kinase
MATKKKQEKLAIVAGNCGVYVGWLTSAIIANGETATVTLRNARHLRRYYVAGRTGDGSVSDLAARGLDPSSPSVSVVTPGKTTLIGVRRVLDVAADVAASFGVPR